MTTNKSYRTLNLDPTNFESTVLALFAILETANASDSKDERLNWQTLSDSIYLYDAVRDCLTELGIDVSEALRLGVIPEKPSSEITKLIEVAETNRRNLVSLVRGAK